MKTIETFSPDDTYHLGQRFGEKAKEGQIYCLEGDLGVGKTIFTKGFAKGLQIYEHVNSPTFTIVQEYNDGRIPFYHFDAYRISYIEEMEDIGYEEYFYGEGVCLIEWGNLIDEIIPKEAIWIIIEKDLQKGFDYRKIAITTQEDNNENFSDR
ncbi:MAG: tRNA (adenosine(37)-N6)-threonylcarbamoyltransferase complex ATPase subunit type 1 TsaE [Eubacteriales bacterium]